MAGSGEDVDAAWVLATADLLVPGVVLGRAGVAGVPAVAAVFILMRGGDLWPPK